jgi:chromosome segregation ATPase
MPPSPAVDTTGAQPAISPSNGSSLKIPMWAFVLLAGAMGGGGGGALGYGTTSGQVNNVTDKVERLEAALDDAEHEITALRIGAGRMETQQVAIQAQLGQIAGQLRAVDAKLDTMIEDRAARPHR